jgi:hypothetical protein
MGQVVKFPPVRDERRLLSACIAFVSEGKRAISLDEIAQRAGISEDQAHEVAVRLEGREFTWGTLRLREAGSKG